MQNLLLICIFSILIMIYKKICELKTISDNEVKKLSNQLTLSKTHLEYIRYHMEDFNTRFKERGF